MRNDHCMVPVNLWIPCATKDTVVSALRYAQPQMEGRPDAQLLAEIGRELFEMLAESINEDAKRR